MHFANSAEEALDRLRANEPICLRFFPLSNAGHGRAAVAQRDQAAIPRLPVLMVTGYRDEERHRRVSELGAANFPGGLSISTN
jgi:CheY-like chemotaxis protein